MLESVLVDERGQPVRRLVRQVTARAVALLVPAAAVMAAAAACSAPGGQETAAPPAPGWSGSPAVSAVPVPAGSSATLLAVPAGEGGGALSGGAVIAAHGSWDRQPPQAPAVLWLAWNASKGTLQPAVTLVGGFENSDHSFWGRPVDAVPGPDGALYVSDDTAGAIYRLAPAS